jgi:hypothetical protein
MKYNPSNLEWADFILASFEGREQELWNNFFTKYEVGTKPSEPTWGKGIRKARWAEYEAELERWNQKLAALTPKFKEECRLWDEKKKKYDEENAYSIGQFAGKALLQRALSGGNVMLIQVPPGGGNLPPTAAPGTQLYKAVVPAGKKTGDQFLAQAGSTPMMVTVPPGVSAGMEISFAGPAPVMAVAQAVPVSNSSTQLPTRKSSNNTNNRSSMPPPAIGTTSTMPTSSATTTTAMGGKSYSFGGSKYPSVG